MSNASTSATDAAAAVVIGGSAGAIEALGILLPSLPAGYRLPVVVVVHIPPHMPSLLVEVFERRCAAKVCEIEDKARMTAGTIFFAPPDYHVLIEDEGTFALSVEPQVHWSRPSIDVLFESAARALGRRVVGVLLTGANDDGVHGLRAIKDAGGLTIAQDPAEAAVPAMPASAIRVGAATRVLRLTGIGAFLLELGAQP